MKSKFNQLYNKIITEIRYRDVNLLNIRGRTISEPPLENIIFEDLAFHTLPRKFTDFLIDKIIWMKNNRILEEIVDLRLIFKTILQEEVENFPEFYNFIQLLSASQTNKYLVLQLGLENSYSEPLELIELADEEYTKIFKNENFKKPLINKIKNKSYSLALKIMKNYLDDFENLGTLIINPHTITNEMYIYDDNDSVIGHEIRHFLIFLQRWSAANYEVCRKYSIQPIDEYDRKNPNFNQYTLNEDEFITLSATYIERLINIFLKFKRSSTEVEITLLIKSILVKSDMSMKNILNNDYYWLNILDINDSHINSIVVFFKNMLFDRKYKFINNIHSKKDKFMTLIKWTLKSFYLKIDELKQEKLKKLQK